MTCTSRTIDFIGRVLYCAHTARLDDTIRDAGKRLAAAANSEHAWLIAEAATEAEAPRDVKIAAFFLLLNVDAALKEAITDIGPHRAAGFYRELSESTVPKYLSDDRVNVGMFVDSVKDAYRNA